MLNITETITEAVIEFINGTGYAGIIFLMALESACIPVPSEIIMPFSGYIVWQGELNLTFAVIAGAVGNLLGSLLAYIIGFKGGRPFLERYGRYIFITHRKLRIADEWFARYGHEAVFISRMLPVIRTFISLPAGISRMDIKKFTVYTFLGSLPWCFILTYAGYMMGPRWTSLQETFHILDYIILISIPFILLYLYRKYACGDT